MIPLRCWARRASDGALCESEEGHGFNHSKGPDPALASCSWSDASCAPDAGPDGRETAAERLLEVAHWLYRLAFRRGHHSFNCQRLRAIAARLRVSADAAAGDLAEVRDGLEEIRGALAFPGLSEEGRRRAEPTAELLTLAADILRPFAEGRR